jgi:NADH-quinone oxidoreductase subunit E
MILRVNIEAIAQRYPEPRSAVMPALYLAQEQYGYITRQAMEEIATTLDLPPVRVYEIATYYTMFRTEPVGKYHLQLCTNVSCMLLEAETLLAYLEKKLDIKSGETTADSLFTLSVVECLGSCGTAPVMQVNDDYCEDLTIEGIDRLLSRLD